MQTQPTDKAAIYLRSADLSLMAQHGDTAIEIQLEPHAALELALKIIAATKDFLEPRTMDDTGARTQWN